MYETLALTQLFIPKLIKKGGGRIIVVSSIAGRFSFSYVGAYAMTKFALEAMSDTLRQELHDYNINVSLIEPGAIATGFNERMIATKYKWWNSNLEFKGEEERVKNFERNFIKDQASTRSVVNSIVHAVESKNPKPRYASPFKYRIILLLNKLLPEKLFDWMIDKYLNK